MKTKIVLAVFGFAVAIFLSCSDNPTTEPSDVDEIQGASSSSNSVTASSSSLGVVGSSSSSNWNGGSFSSSSSNKNNPLPLDINTGKNNIIPIYPCSQNAVGNGFMTSECYDLTFGKYEGSVALIYYEVDTDGLILLRRSSLPVKNNGSVTGAGFCDWNGITDEQASQIMLNGTATAELIEYYSLNDLENLYTLKYGNCFSDYSKPSSSSSISSSSSRITTSSSSAKLSSSSIVPSSSSTKSSSSSTVPSSSSIATSGSFTDSRDGTVYKWVRIGTQTWMAENLNYNIDGSKCYSNDDSYCETYGRLYNWSAAGGACPSGWHLPNNTEWNTLMKFVNPSCPNTISVGCANAGNLLKATSGWKNNGQDTYGFSALPGGYGGSDGGFGRVGDEGYWWSARTYDSYSAYHWYMMGDDVFLDYRNRVALLSVRCLQD